MCGIAGYFGPGMVNEERVLGSLRHRGPDARGCWRADVALGNRVQLIHTRLKIIDLSEAAAQPMLIRRLNAPESSQPEWSGTEGPAQFGPDFEPDASAIVLIFNGEIYNFHELRAQLEAAGHRFRSSGDTEVLLRGYAQWGRGVFARLDGMFALALYDGPAGQLVLARDHAGIKPLYYARSRDGGLIFSSEVRTVLGSGLCTRRIDAIAVADYLSLGSCQEPRTLAEDVRAFPPGHIGVIRVDEGSPAVMVAQPYWLPERVAIDREADDPAWAEEHRACLIESVREQLVADVPVGVFLSGGLDSTLLMELAAASGSGKIVAFTLGGRLTEFNEGVIAAESARNAGVHHLLVQLDDGEVQKWVGDGLSEMDQPSADGMNTYLVSRAARAEGLVVVLAGTGADELHGAYGHARMLSRTIRTMGRLGPLAGVAARAAVAGMRLRSGPVQSERLSELLAAAPSPWRVLQERRRFFTGSQRAALWPAGSGVRPGWCPPYVDAACFGERGLEEQIRLSEIRGYLLNTLLRDCDWATMANQQELRVPFLGRRYMNCVLRAPERATEANGVPKPQLAAMLSPASRRLASLPKRGFTMDYLAWLKGPLGGEFNRAVSVLTDVLGFEVDAGLQMEGLSASGSQREARRCWALLALGNYILQNGLTH